MLEVLFPRHFIALKSVYPPPHLIPRSYAAFYNSKIGVPTPPLNSKGDRSILGPLVPQTETKSTIFFMVWAGSSKAVGTEHLGPRGSRGALLRRTWAARTEAKQPVEAVSLGSGSRSPKRVASGEIVHEFHGSYRP